MAAVICEADMELDKYLHTKTESDSKNKIKDHMCKKTTCRNLAYLMKETVLKKREEKMMNMAEIKEAIMRIKFQA